MNKTKIEWCDMTWNPVTGCLHGCEYCYARKIARRFSGWDCLGKRYCEPLPGETGVLDEPLPYIDKDNKLLKAPYPYGFIPTFHRYRLGEPARKTKSRNIFVCSMADLFGKWVPDEWIQEVFKACEAAPQHNYLFLTKNSDRYLQTELSWKKNIWFGTTITGGQNNRNIMEGYNTFVSIEPLLEIPVNYDKWIPLVKWIIIGAETGNRKGKVIPGKSWVDKIVVECRKSGVPVFMKNSLLEIMGADFVQEYPTELIKP